MNVAFESAIAATSALAAAALFGIGVALQHRQVQAVDGGERPRHLVTQLLRRRLWLVGVALTVLAYGFQGLALSFGPLTLVAPIVALDLLFAIPVAARWSGRRTRMGDWFGCAFSAGGIAAFVVASPPSSGRSTAPAWQWIIAAGGVALVAGCAIAAANFADGRARVAMLSGAAGVVFGITAAVTLSLTRELRLQGVGLLFGIWQTWVLVGLGMAGFVLSAIAYRAGELSISLPIMDTVEPLTGVLLGTLVFGEPLAASPAGLLAQCGGGVLALVGIVMLGRSAVINAVPEPAITQGEAAAFGPGSRP